MLGDRLAHRLARLRVLERVVGRALRDAERLRGDARARAVEDAHRDPEALALLAEEVRRRGCGTASNVSSPVVEPEMPIFGSSRATAKPGASASTTKAEIPAWPASGSVFAKTV